MTRKGFTEYILNNYVTNEEKPWADSSEFSVFRHLSNKKWFAIIMPVAADKFGLDHGGEVEVVNLKCEPFLIDAFLDGKSVFRAYHMNKTHWISVIINLAEEEKLKMLVDMSFGLTDVRRKYNEPKNRRNQAALSDNK